MYQENNKDKSNIVINWFIQQFSQEVQNFSNELEKSIFNIVRKRFITFARLKKLLPQDKKLNGELVKEISTSSEYASFRTACYAGVIDFIINNSCLEVKLCAITKKQYPLLIKTGNLFVSPNVLLHAYILDHCNRQIFPKSLHKQGEFVVHECIFTTEEEKVPGV
jgi:hypothetical protein